MNETTPPLNVTTHAERSAKAVAHNEAPSLTGEVIFKPWMHLYAGDHTTMHPPEKQRENLSKLSAYLIHDALPQRFDMGSYAYHDEDVPLGLDGLKMEVILKKLPTKKEIKNECMSSGCAVGHGLSAGVPWEGPPANFHWSAYAKQAFAADQDSHGYREKIWKWCFSATWEEYDNTPRGAGLRIRYMLDRGIPDSFGWNSSNMKHIIKLYWSHGKLRGLI